MTVCYCQLSCKIFCQKQSSQLLNNKLANDETVPKVRKNLKSDNFSNVFVCSTHALREISLASEVFTSHNKDSQSTHHSKILRDNY